MMKGPSGLTLQVFSLESILGRSYESRRKTEKQIFPEWLNRFLCKKESTTKIHLIILKKNIVLI